MKSIPGYGKVLTLGSAYTENALVGDVAIQEKIDGSLFGFGLNEDRELVMRSKGLALTEDNHAQMFSPAVKYAVSIVQKLIDNVSPDTYLYCEYLEEPKHNTLKYDRIPKNNLVIFDAVVRGKYADRKELVRLANLFEIDVIPELYSGNSSVEQIKELLTTNSYLGNEIVEGVVIKNYAQTILLGGVIFPLFTKYVREAFKERHDADWKVRQPKGVLQEFIDGFKSEARWEKAVVHAREKGLLTTSPRDIGVLIPTIQNDIKEEEEENIKRHLYKCFIDDILRKSVAGFPEWYKNKLLENVKSV